MLQKQEANVQENPAVRLLTNLPAIMKNSRLWVCYRVNHKKNFLAIHAAEMLFASNQQDRDRTSTGQQMRTDAFLRLARDAKILVPTHPDKPWGSIVLTKSADGDIKPRNQKCFLFDLSHPIVKEVAESIEAHFGQEAGRANDPSSE
jgi:hypothetical protein